MSDRDARKRMAAAGVLIGLAALSIWTSACGAPAAPAEARAGGAAGDVVVATPWPWKRRQNMLFRQGLDLAVEQINAAGGINGRSLRLLPEDDEDSVNTGRLIAQRLSRDPTVVAVVGHLQSYVARPAAAIYDQAGLLVLAPTATTPDLTTQGYGRTFRTIFTDDEVGRQMAEYAGRRGCKRAAIFYMRSDYGRRMANAFEERAVEGGMTVVDRQSFNSDTPVNPRNLTVILDDWAARGLDALFLATEGSHAAVIARAIRARGLKWALIGGDALGTSDLFSEGTEVVEGAVLASPFHPDEPRDEVKRFVTAFRGRFQGPPDAAAALAYDTITLLAHAMTQSRSTNPATVAQALHALKGWPAVTGPITFSPEGDLIGRSVVTLVAREGRFEYLPSPAAKDPR
jgi:branched-chain amino acid transport system substrate-binding protein